MKPVKITSDNIDTAIQKFDALVILCGTIWCPHCADMNQRVNKLSAKISTVVFGKLNIDENAPIMGRYDITTAPTTLLFKSGELVYKFTGAKPIPFLVGCIREYLK